VFGRDVGRRGEITRRDSFASKPTSVAWLVVGRTFDGQPLFVPQQKGTWTRSPRFLLTFGKPGQYSATLSEYPTDSHFQSFEFAEFHSLISVVCFNRGTN
jgi:hypothetical protein